MLTLLPAHGIRRAKLGSPRPVKARSFALENLERRLLLSGNFVWANAAGGDYNYGSNWVGGQAPDAGSNITIGALNPGAFVAFHGNDATLASVTISSNGALIVQSGSLSVTNSLNIAAGGSLSVVGAIRNTGGDGANIPTDATVNIEAGATMNVNGGTVNIRHNIDATFVVAQGTVNVLTGASLAVSNGGAINVADGALYDLGTANVAADSTLQLSGSGFVDVTQTGVLTAAGTGATALSLAGQAGLMVDTGGSLTVNDLTAANSSYLEVQNGGSLANLNGAITLNDSSALTLTDDGLTSLAATGSLALHSYAQVNNYGGTLHLSGPTTSDGPTSYTGYGKLILGSNANPTGPPVDFGSSFTLGYSGSVEGWGTITAQTINLAGTISPGGTGQIGTLGFSSPGEINQQPETSLVFEFEIGATGADQVHFTSTDVYPGLLGFYSPEVDISYVAGFTPTAGFVGTTDPLVTLTNFEVSTDHYGLPEYGLFGQVNTVFGEATHPGLDILTGADASMSVRAAIADTGSTFTYTGPNQGSVSDPANWSGGQLPTFGSNVVIPTGVEAYIHSGVYEAFNTITVDGTLTSKTTHASIVLGGGDSTVNNLNFNNQEGAFLTVGANATLTITGTAAFDSASGLVANGTVRLADGSTLANQNNQDFAIIIYGTLAGTGTFEGNADIFGTLAPGGVSTVGTLTFTDHLSLEPGASLLIRLADANVSDQVVVEADASLSDTAVNIQLLNSGVSSYTVDFLTAAYDIGGNFGTLTVTGPGSSGFSASVATHYGAQVAATLTVGSGGGGGSESTLSTTLRAGLPDLQAIIREFGPYFNLGAINYAATGTTQPNLAVLPAALDSLFGISGLLSGATLPTISATTDNNTLVAALIGAGFTVDAIAGGATYNATVIPDVTSGSGLQIQIHYTASLLSNLTVSGSYSGNTFSDTTPNLLQGLASSLSLNGAITWTGSLGLSLVFGVDASGFFVAPSSALVLSAAGTGTVSGTGTIGGKSAISLTGTGAANLTVNLELGASGTPYRLTDLDGHLADKLVPLIAGTSSLSVNATVGPLSLTYTGNYTQTADLAAHTQTCALAGAVTGTLTIPGLKTAAGDPAALPVTGTFDSGSNSWTLTVSATDLRFSGLTVTSASFSITLSAATFAGSGAMNLQMTFFTSSATPVTLALTASFDANTGTFGTDVVPPDVTVLNNQGGTLLTTTNVHITATLTADFGAGTLTGSMSLTAGGGTLTAFTLSNATHPASPAVSLSYDFATQLISLSIDTLSVAVNHGFSLTVAGLTATYDRSNNDPNQVLATVVNVTVKLGALNGPTTSGPPAGPDPSLTVSSLTLTQTGFSLSDTATVLDAHVGSFLSLNSANVCLNGVGYDASGYHGAITLSATAGQLYTGQNLITASVGATTGAFDLAAQAFSLTASHLSLAAGSAFVVSADGVALHYDPAAAGAQVFATLATATATSAQLSSMGSATLSGLQLATNGISFGSFSFGKNPGDPNPVLGTILELVNPTVSVSNFSFTYGATSSASGTVGFAADSAKLYPAAGAALASSLTGVAGSYDFASPGATGALTLSVASLSLTVANALTLTASNVTLSPEASTIATIATATLTSPTLAGLGSATISGFELNQTGFTIHAATLNQPAGSTATFGSVLSLTDASITVSELSYSTTATDPFSGTMSLGFGSAALFPGATGFLSTTLTGVSAGFDLGGPSPTGHLNFTVGTFALRVGDAFVVTASNVTLTPAETTIATITSATLSSPLITGLPTAALSSLVITQNGFSVADFTLAQAANATVTIGSSLSLTGAALTVTGFAYDATNSTNPVTGTVTLTITGASLFSNQSVFTTTLSGFSASFGFGGAAPHGALSITVGTFTLGIGEALQVTASNVTLTPSASTLLTLATATVTSPTITNLASATLSNLGITQTGFSLGSFTLAQTGGATARIGNVLSLTGASLVVTNLTYDTTHTASPITGTIALTVGSASLYPDATAFSSTLGNLVATYLLGGADPTGRLSIAVGTFSLTLGEALRITASDLTLTPGATTIATIGTATLASPLITGLASASLNGFLLTQTGFSIGSLTLAASAAGTPARIGDFLALTNASLQVSGFSYDSTNSAHPIAGTVALSFGEVQLYPDSTAFTTTLTGAAASYDFSQTGSLQISATAFELKIGEAIDLTAGALTITPGQETLFTLATAAITSPQFPAFAGGSISHLVVTRTGFTLGSFVLGQGGQQVEFGNFLRLDGATFTATGFAVSYGAGGTTFGGTIGLSATGVSLFPGSDLFHTTVGNFTTSYDFSPGGDGALHIHAGTFTLQIGEVLAVSASNVEIRPGQEIMFTLDNATVSSPQFTDFAAAQVSDLEFRQDGFRLGNFSLGTQGGQEVNFGSVLKLTGATFTATDFAVNYGATTTVSGTIGLAATGVALFPNSELFTTKVENFTMHYALGSGGDGALHIHAGTFTLSIGEAVQVTASDVEIEPGQATMFSVASATVSSPQFTDFDPVTISTLTVTQTGFSLGSFSLGTTAGQEVNFGSFLRLNGAKLTVSDFVVNYGSTTTVSGTIGLIATGLQLFPGSGFLTTTVTGLAASYDYSPGATGALSIHVDTFDLKIGDALDLAATDVTITPGQAIIMTLGSALATSPSLTGFGSVALTDFVVRQDGFSFGHFQFGQGSGQTVDFGSTLELRGAVLTVDNFKLSLANNVTTITGTIGLTAASVMLFPGATFFTINLTGLSITYDLGSNTGTGALDISVATFSLQISNALVITASNVVITPGRPTILLIGTATVTSPAISGISGSISGFTLTQSGFSIGSLDLSPIPGNEVKFGNILTFTGITIHVGNFVYDSTQGTLAGTISVGAQSAVLFPGNSTFTATVTAITGGYTLGASGFGALSLSIGGLSLQLGTFLTFTGTNLVLTPEADTVLTVGSISATVTVGSITIGGTGSNFAITKSGGFQALSGFGVALDLNTDSSSFKWPSWLPIHITTLALQWPDISNHPLDFSITLSASVSSLNGLPVGVSGSISGLVIDLGELSRGNFPVTDIGSASITINGGLFGGQVSGSLVLGVVKIDAAGNQIAATDTTTAVAQRVLYGGIRASLSFAGISGFSISIGVSQLGPLSIYVSAGIPILLDPNSGLSITNFYAGVVFDQSLPSITDPKALRGSAFLPANQLTDAQWVAQLESSVVNQARAPPGSSWNVFSQTMLIEGGVTLFSAYTSTLVFHADLSIIISTDGKFLVSGSLVFGNSLTLKGSIYADLSQVRSGNATFLFLVDAPEQSPVLTIYGGVLFTYHRNDGTAVTDTHPADTFTIEFTGGVDFSAGGLVNASVTGTVDLSFGTDRFDLLLHGSINLPLLGDALGVAGSFHLTTANGVKFWGALVVQPNFTALTQLGLTATGIAILRVNSTTDDLSETLTVPGQTDPSTYTLAAQSVSVLLQGTVAFSLGGADWFNVTGTWAMEITPTRLSVLGVGTLNVGPTGSPFLVYNYNGFFQIDSTGVAATLGVTQTGSFPGNVGLSLTATWQVTLNTTGHDVTFTLPPGTAAINGATSFTITGAPAAAPGDPTVYPAAPYLEMIASGDLNVLNSFTLHGTFFFLLSPGVLELTASATLALTAGSATILSFNVSGGIKIDATGAVAVLDLALNASVPIPANLGLSISGSFELQLNTTNAAQNIAGVALDAGSYVKVIAFNATLLELGVSLTGSFSFTSGIVNGLPTLQITADANLMLNVGGASGLTLFSFTVKGALLIDTDGIAAYFALTTGSGLGAGGTLGYQFLVGATLEINTTGKSHQFTTASGTATLTEGANGSTTPGNYAEIDLSGQLIVGGLTLSGDFFVAVTPTALTVYASATLALQLGGSTGTVGANLFSFAVTGGMVINSDGLAGYVSLAIGASSAGSSAYSFSADATLEINTTQSGIDVATANGSRHLTSSANGVETADHAGTAYAQVWLHGSLTVSALFLSGDFYASVNSTSLTIYASATVKLQLGGSTGRSLYSFAVTGGMVINSSGLAGYVALATNVTSAGTSAYTFTANAVLEINTTRSGIDVATANGPQHLTSSANLVETAAGAGIAYAQVWLHGSLRVGSLAMTGEFYASVNATGLTIYANATLALQTGGTGGTTLFTFSVTGGLVITPTGLAGYVKLATGASSTGGVGYGFGADAVLEINTTGSGVTVPTADGPTYVYSGPNHVDVSPGVAYAQVWLHGSLTVGALVITGEFYASVTATSLTVYANATLTLKVGGTSGATLFTLSAVGGMTITTSGLAAYVALGVTAGAGDANYSFANISATLVINTTNSHIQIGSGKTAKQIYAGVNHLDNPSGAYAEVDLNGSLSVAGLTITGDFFVGVTSTSLLVYASATLKLQVGGTSGATLFTFSVTGAMLLDQTGLAVYLAIGGGTNNNTTDYGFTITATLQINTTGSQHIFQLAGLPVTLYAGANNSTSAGVYAEVDLNGTLKVAGLTITGDFYASVTPTSLLLYASATLTLQLGGSTGATLFSFSVTGALLLDATGLAVYLNIGSGTNTNTTDYQFSINATLQLNTTLTQHTFQLAGLPVTLYAGANNSTTGGVYAEVDLSGSLKVGSLAVTGDFFASVTPTSLLIYAIGTVTLKIGGNSGTTLFTLAVNGAMLLGPSGLAVYLSLSSGSTLNSQSALGYQFSIKATLQINTTLTQQTFQLSSGPVTLYAGANGSTTAAKYAEVDLNGSLTVDGLALTGDFYVGVSAFSLTVYAKATLTLKVGGANSATLLTLAMTGGLLINTRGLAAYLNVAEGVTATSNSSVLNYQFNVSATVLINTIGSNVSVGGTPVSGTAAGATTAGSYAQADLSGTLTVGGLTITGDFFVSVSFNSLQIYADATLLLKAAGTTVLSIDFTGAMLINSLGIAAFIDLTAGTPVSSTSGLNYAFSVTATFKLNTTGAPVVLDGTPLKSGNYAQVVLSGTLVAYGLTLDGTFTVTAGTVNGVATLEISANAGLTLQAGSTTIFTLTVIGAMRITTGGIAAWINLTTGSNTASSAAGLNYSFTATAIFQLNTTGAAQTVGGQTLDAGRFARVVLTGDLTVLGLTIHGGFTLTAGTYNGATSIDIAAAATLDLKAGGVSVLTLGVTGAMRITAAGIAASITVDVSGGAPSGLGFAFNVTGVLQINTTSTTQTFTVPFGRFFVTATLPAGPYAQAYLSGTLTVLGLTISANFTITADLYNGAPSLTVVLGSASVVLQAGSTAMFTFSTSGGLRITSDGIAAYLNVSLTAGPPSGLGFTFGATLTGTLQINTTSSAQVFTYFIGNRLFFNSLAAGPYAQISISATLSLGVLQLGGTFTLTAGVHNGVATVQLGVTATLNVNIGSLTIFTFSVSGNMRVTSGGIAAALSLTLTSGVPSGLGFSLSPLAYTNFLLIVNTTSSLQNLDSQTTVPPGPYVYLAGQAVLVVGGFNVTGQFNLTVSSSGISVFASAQVSIFGVTGSVSGTFGIYADGVVLGLTVTLPTISTYFFSLSGTLSLQLNSTNRTVNGIQGQTYQVAVTNARLSLLGFTLSGSLTIGVINGYFFITVPSTAPLTVSVLGLATVSLSGSLRSDGTFSLSGSVSLGSGGVAALGDINVAALVGSMTVTLSSSHGFYGAFTGDLYLFGQDVGHVAANTTISATPFTYSIPTYTYYSIFSDPVDYARYPHGKVTGSIDFANSYLVVQATGAFNLSRFGLDLSLNGSATLAVGPAGLSGIFDISGKLFGVSTSAHFYLDAASHYWIATASLSVNLGDNNFGLSASASATISSDWTQDGITLGGSAWAQYDGIGASATFSAHGDLSGNLSFTVNMTFIFTVGIGFNVSLEGGFKLSGSDLAGGYAFLDTTGNGVWDASMARTPVDADGNFNFAVGDPTQWVVDTAGGYAFRDLNGNGTWDQTTEAYVPLKADGSLPDAIAQLLDPTVNLGAGATDAASVLGLLRQYAVQDVQGLPTGALNLALGHVKAIGGNVVKADGSAGAANTAVIDLGGRAAGYTGLTGAGQTVFFDTNGNGVLDPGEVSVTASNTGFFTFAPNLPHTQTLGLLAGFDTNGNGIIDPAEGSIVVTGAHDKNNGVATALIFRIAASNLNGLSTAANPLATLRTAMVGLGATGPQADARLSYAFNLSTALDFSTFVPSNPTTSAADRSAVLVATAQVETLLLNAASLLSAASHGSLTAAAAQQLAITQLALTLLSSALTPPAGNPIQTGPALDLTDVALISAFFNTVATTANLALDPAVLNAAARITAALNLAAAGYAAAGGDPTRQLARIDALVEGQLGAALGDLAAGTLAPATALTLYTGGNLTNLLNAVVLTPIVAPTVATPDDISVQGGTAIAPIVLDITSATTLQSHLVVTATSSNQQLLPDAGVVVGLSGDHHVLFLQPAAGQAGTTIITLTVSDGSLVTTRSFRVTVIGELISAPVITSTPVTTALVGQTYTYGVTVSSADPTRTFVITAAQPLPAWLTLTDNGDGTATLSGIPPAGLLGAGGLALQAIALKATDDRGSTVQQGFTVVVTAQPLDSIQLTGDSPADATVGTPFSLHFTATTDDSAGPLVFSLPGGLPAWLHLADNGDGTATLSGTPTFADTGALALTLVVTDANGQIAARSVAFNVTSAQGISALGDLTQPANSTRTIGFTLTGVDAGTQLTVASNNPGLIDPSGLILGGAGSTRTLTLIPRNGTSGNATITLTLLENGVVTATRTFQLTVTSIAPPIAPVIAPVGNVTLTENSNGTITLTLGGIDLSAQLSATSDNSALIDSTGLLLSGTGFTRTLKLTPKTDATGNATITLTLSDGGLVTSLSFQLTVTAVDHPVTLLFALPAFAVSPGSGNITIDLSHYFSNIDGTTTYALGRNTDAALLGARIDGNQLILTPAAARAGLAALDIIATSKGAGTGQIFTVTGTVHVAVLPDVLLSGPSYLRLADGSIVARFTVALSVVSNQAVRVAYGTSDGTARSGVDYTGAQGYVDIAAGALSATIDIRIAGTSLYPNLDFTLALNSALSALLQDRTNAQVAIPVDRVALFSQQGGATIGFGLVVSFLTSPGSDSLDYTPAITGVNVVVEKFTPAQSAGMNSVTGSGFSFVAETSLSSLAVPHRMKGYGQF